jgi:hypothetical protein
MAKFYYLSTKMAEEGLLIILALILLPIAVLAAQLEVRRPANIYSEPNKNSEILTRLDKGDRDGPLLIKLLDEEKTNGYYRIQIPGKSKKGWIYKTYVRRYDRPHPEYRPYSRSLYRHWIDEDGDCQDTRVEVLVRDAIGRLVFADEKDCKVKGGKWKDPYTAQTVTDPKKLDVDHMVPLKNAHESGAWAWSAKRKQEYANYMEFNRHLLAVSLSENRKKGDKGPDKYLPPIKTYRCTYAQDWAKIKEEWELEMTEDEGMAVSKILEECR